MNLCNDLRLIIVAEEGVVRIKLVDELNMSEVEVCQEINQTNKHTAKSAHYFVREAVVIAMRRLVSDAFADGLISDSLGEWKIANIEIEMD